MIEEVAARSLLPGDTLLSPPAKGKTVKDVVSSPSGLRVIVLFADGYRRDLAASLRFKVDRAPGRLAARARLEQSERR